MLCSKCAANLPDGSQFCLKCGEPVSAPPNSTALVTTKALSACRKCGANLPDEAEFCLKCGQPVRPPQNSEALTTRSVALEPVPPGLPRPRRKRRVGTWLILVLAIVVIAWAATSDNLVAQQIQELVGWKHDQTIVDASFSVTPHNFRYYKFSLPEGSVNVAVVGQFASASDSHGNDRRNNGNDKDKDTDRDNNIEVYVLTEPAFTIWQNGYATGSLYESGRVAEGKVQTDVPAGAGIYYLVFSNKFAPKSPKTVHATALLRYKSWLPEGLRKMKDHFWNWIGL